MKNLKIAKKDAENILLTEENNYSDFLLTIIPQFNESEKLHLRKFDVESKAKINQRLRCKYQKKLAHLKLLNNIPPNESRIEGFEKVKSKTRRFYKRTKYQKLKKKEAMKRVSSLVFNLSDFPITTHMQNLLNHGLSFVPIPDKLNITQVKTELNRYERSMLWKDFWFENEPNIFNEEDSEYVKSVFKSNQTNLPKGGTSDHLKIYLHSVHSDIIGSCRKRSETKKKYNLLQEEQIALKALREVQSKGEITIKECDKGGGVCIMSTHDYIARN